MKLMTTYTNQAQAEEAMRICNRARKTGRFNHAHPTTSGDRQYLCGLLVMVEGPNDNEWTLMDLGEAINNDFDFSWTV
jgi:hypothetical protein